MLKPIYAKNNPAFRICYKANGQWRLQEHAQYKGTRDSDPWHDMSPPLSQDEALKVLSRHHIEKR